MLSFSATYYRTLCDWLWCDIGMYSTSSKRYVKGGVFQYRVAYYGTQRDLQSMTFRTMRQNPCQYESRFMQIGHDPAPPPRPPLVTPLVTWRNQGSLARLVTLKREGSAHLGFTDLTAVVAKAVDTPVFNFCRSYFRDPQGKSLQQKAIVAVLRVGDAWLVGVGKRAPLGFWCLS